MIPNLFDSPGLATLRASWERGVTETLEMRALDATMPVLIVAVRDGPNPDALTASHLRRLLVPIRGKIAEGNLDGASVALLGMLGETPCRWRCLRYFTVGGTWAVSQDRTGLDLMAASRWALDWAEACCGAMADHDRPAPD